MQRFSDSSKASFNERTRDDSTWEVRQDSGIQYEQPTSGYREYVTGVQRAPANDITRGPNWGQGEALYYSLEKPHRRQFYGSILLLFLAVCVIVALMSGVLWMLHQTPHAQKK